MSEETIIPVPEPAPEPPAMSSIEWRGIKVNLLAFVKDLDPDALEAFENGRAITGLRSLMGSKQYDAVREEFKTKFGHKPTLLDIAGDENDGDATKAALATAVAEHFGFSDTGE